MDIYKFDDEELAYAYECAPRFDEGEIRQSDEYSDICRRKIDIYEFIIAKYQMYGDEIEHLLWEFEDTFSDEMELEAMHFFAEGYTAGIVGGENVQLNGEIVIFFLHPLSNDFRLQVHAIGV